MVRKIWYGVLILITAYLEIMYDSTWLLSLLAFEILLAVVLYLLSWYFRLHISIWLDMKVPVAQKKEKFELEFHMKNTGIFPVSSVYAILNCENRSGGSSEKRILDESIGARSEKTVQITVSSDYSGNVGFSLKRVQVRDYLGLFQRKIKSMSQISVNVLPDIQAFPVVISMRTRNFPVEGDAYETDRSGDDPSEIFQIREFRPGDRLQRIHWKTSARMDDLMTKEYSMPRGCKVLFLLDARQKEADPQKADCFLERVASLSFSMLEAECPHFTAWYDESKGRILRKAIEKEQDIYEMLDQVMTAPLYEQQYDIEAAYRSAYPEGTYSTVLLLDKEGVLKKNDEQIVAFEGQDAKENLPELEV